MRYVYKLINGSGEVEYIGETKSTRWRWYDHVRRKRGRFYGRTDITLQVLSEHECRFESYRVQCEWQRHFGLKTDLEIASEGFAKGRKILKGLKTN